MSGQTKKNAVKDLRVKFIVLRTRNMDIETDPKTTWGMRNNDWYCKEDQGHTSKNYSGDSTNKIDGN